MIICHYQEVHYKPEQPTKHAQPSSTSRISKITPIYHEIVILPKLSSINQFIQNHLFGIDPSFDSLQQIWFVC